MKLVFLLAYLFYCLGRAPAGGAGKIIKEPDTRKAENQKSGGVAWRDLAAQLAATVLWAVEVGLPCNF
jgi:hypothetical protein